MEMERIFSVDGQGMVIWAADGSFVGYEFTKTQEEFYACVEDDAV